MAARRRFARSHAQGPGRTALLYVLFEHQSTRDPWTPLRLLRYQVRIWTQYLADHPEAERLPPIVSAVLQHDPRSGPPPPCFADLLDADDGLLALLRPFTPDFRFVLDDLREVDDDELRAGSKDELQRWARRVLNAETPEDVLA